MFFIKNLNNWLKALRLPFLSTSFTSVFIGWFLSYDNESHLKMELLILVLLGVGFIHLGANLLNDFFDCRNGSDKVNDERLSPFTGGSRVIQDGLIMEKKILIVGVFFLLAGSLIGAYLAFARGVMVCYFGLLGILSAVFYSWFWVSRYLGETIVGVTFGTLIITGSDYVFSGHLHWKALFLSIPVSILVTMILWLNQFPDYKADKQCGKTNLVVRLGRKKSAFVYIGLMFSVYVSIGFVALAYNQYSLLFSYLTLPMGLYMVVKMLRNYDHPGKMKPVFVLNILTHAVISFFIVCSLLKQNRVF